MLNLPKHRLGSTRIRIRNPTANQLTVWLEPWAENFKLAPTESIDVILVGPKDGVPELLPKVDSISIYGWEGAEAVAVKSGQQLTPQASVEEIVRQEIEIAKEQAARTDTAVPAHEIILAQNSLDSILPFDADSISDVSKIIGYFICELAGSFQPTEAMTDAMWRIAQRIVGTKGFFLAVPNLKKIKSALWSATPTLMMELVEKNIISILDGRLDNKRLRNSKPPSSEFESRSSSS
jgi:hypothetical protein